jgi:hypothetical protein
MDSIPSTIIRRDGNLIRTDAISQSTMVVIIAGFMIMNSVSNLDAKAFVWLGQVCFWLLILRYATGGKQLECNTDKLITPIMSSFFIAYTLGYMAAPMAVYKDWNIFVVAAFVFMFFLDFTIGIDKCGKLTKTWLVVSGFSGLILGVVFFFILKAIGMEKFLYYTTGTNNVYCAKPAEQDFKCFVYKNGHIISSL